MNNRLSQRFADYKSQAGGRVFILFLLFILAIYEFYSMGIVGYALVCMVPLAIVFLLFSFRHKMVVFWYIFIINYIIMGLSRYYSIPIPITALTIMPQIFLLMVCIWDVRDHTNAKYGNIMLLAIIIWSIYIILQLFNETCMLPISFSAWGMNFTFFSLLFILAYFLITNLIRTPERIMKLLRVWAYLAIIADFWTWRQQNIGWDDTEWGWLMAVGARTHLIGGSIRYFSFFSDAANYGCSIAASTIVFYIVAITTKLKKDKILFFIAALFSTYGFFASGTRTALVCFMAGVFLYVILSKSFKIAIPVFVLGALFYSFLAFTDIGQGNMQIRRMRSAFNKSDASANVRDINKATLAKYLKDAPFGMGLNVDEENVPANHKYKKVYETSNDSTYVFMWQRVGIVGAVLFAIVNGMILIGGCIITMFRLKSKICIGIAAAMCCAFIAIQVGGYANHILTQYPNLLLYYGGMAIVYLLPDIEQEFITYENKLFAEQEEKKRIKLEKKLASRV